MKRKYDFTKIGKQIRIKREADAARKKAEQQDWDKSVRTYKPMSTFAKVGIGAGLGFIVALLILRNKGK